MSTFELYFRLGFKHIVDIGAFDHILFLVALCALYQLKEWKRITVLVTAFTIGHSLTLILSTLNLVSIPSNIVEFFIAVTILLTAFNNVWQGRKPGFFEQKPSALFDLRQSINYGIALFFGMIHGLGFSEKLKAMLGMDESLLEPLLGFNIGVEVGQLLIVAIILGLAYGLSRLGMKQRTWVFSSSIIAAGFAIYYMIERSFW